MKFLIEVRNFGGIAPERGAADRKYAFLTSRPYADPEPELRVRSGLPN